MAATAEEGTARKPVCANAGANVRRPNSGDEIGRDSRRDGTPTMNPFSTDYVRSPGLLLTCPLCGMVAFPPRGLSLHLGNEHCAARQEKLHGCVIVLRSQTNPETRKNLVAAAVKQAEADKALPQGDPAP